MLNSERNQHIYDSLLRLARGREIALTNGPLAKLQPEIRDGIARGLIVLKDFFAPSGHRVYALTAAGAKMKAEGDNEAAQSPALR